jgi:hypothetical protein
MRCGRLARLEDVDRRCCLSDATLFLADPHALGTTLLEEGEDDEDIQAAWYTRIALDKMIKSMVVPVLHRSIIIRE